jgi:S-adenosylmethionine-diacylglycerol 3-amino-3-carboxypropyl transferase
MNTALPGWVEQAAALPLAFAQVREDPLLDGWVGEQLPDASRVMMIASGGCTAAFLASSPKVAELRLIDPNPAQLALTRLKLRLLQTSPPESRLALLGHAPLRGPERQAWLKEEWRQLQLPPECLGPPAFVAEIGPDHAGRYERVFAQLRLALHDQTEALENLLNLHDPGEQDRLVNPAAPLGQGLDAALDEVMAIPNLVRLFGAEATKNPVEPFSRHFARRLRHVLATLPADSNPYLWQMLLGRYPEGHEAPWLRLPSLTRLPPVTWETGFMADALWASPSTSFDFVHLSNILDWLTPENAQATLELTGQALRPGGYTLIRQLNSTLDIQSLGPMFEWLTPQANALHARDRSFFYRALHLGRKR